MIEMDYCEPTAIVTGASKGIGLNIATKLAQQGYSIAACSRSLSDELKVLVDGDPRHSYFSLDLGNGQSIKDCARAVLKWAGKVDALVNCAGQANGNMFLMTRIDDMRHLFDVNLFGSLQFTQYVAKKMIRHKMGSIVNIASTAGLLADKGTLAYGGSKAALIHATKVIAAELGTFNIRVNAIAPAVVETGMAELMDEEARKVLNERSALAGSVEPEDITNLVSFLISDDSSRISGQIIRVDRAMPF